MCLKIKNGYQIQVRSDSDIIGLHGYCMSYEKFFLLALIHQRSTFLLVSNQLLSSEACSICQFPNSILDSNEAELEPLSFNKLRLKLVLKTNVESTATE